MLPFGSEPVQPSSRDVEDKPIQMNLTPEFWTAFATVVIAIFTIVLAISGSIQAWLTRNAINLARAEFTASQRPKIVVRELVMLPCAPEPKVEVRYVVANVGASEAKIVESWIEIQENRILQPLQPMKEVNQIGKVIIEPGASICLVKGSESSDVSITLVSMDVGRHGSDDPDLFFHGFITYRDKNQLKRRTAFCRRYDFEARRFCIVGDPDYEYAD